MVNLIPRIKKGIRRVKRTIRRKKIVEESGLNRQIRLRKKLRFTKLNKPMRIYENEIGEVFGISRRRIPGKNSYFVKIRDVTNVRPFGYGVMKIDSYHKAVNISQIGLYRYAKEKKGREIFRMFLDEAIQIGFKTFKENYDIIIFPADKELREYYKSFGFVEFKNGDLILTSEKIEQLKHKHQKVK
ncbi:MAG: hypothetical protein PHQ98_00210 [Candidatus ainarchaeum sp.]|nr:hypothetical protein [Candidatus ainarchaeum sp.]